MAIDDTKLIKAQAATDVVLAGWHAAQDALRICYTNGYGALSEPSQASGKLHEAKQAIERAQAAIRGCDWDYGE